ncbi:MAG: MaoC/PaaZ C-terminal domain-containing protein, partial [Pseudomonadota bacterium]
QPAGAPSAGPELDLSAAERVRWIFQLAPTLFPAEKIKGKDTSIDFDLAGEGLWRLTWSDDGATAQKDPAGEPAASRVKADPAVLCNVIDRKIDAAEAFRQMKIVASRMADFLSFSEILRTQDYTKAIADALAECPVQVPSDYMGRTFHESPLVIRYEHASDYARATSVDNPKYFRDKSEIVETPPLLAVRYHFDLARTILTDPALEVNIMRLVHGEQEMIFHQPLRPGDVIVPKASICDVEHKEAGSLITISFRLMREGQLANETFSRYFVRRDRSGGDKKKKKEEPKPVIEKPDFTVAVDVAGDQSKLYAKASLDENPIHLNLDIARAAGFKALVLHGLCVLGFASNAVIAQAAGDDPTRLASIKARFSRPVFMGDRLETRGSIGKKKDETKVAFEVVNQDNVPVITAGLADIRPS